jgi:hypothetical protein
LLDEEGSSELELAMELELLLSSVLEELAMELELLCSMLEEETSELEELASVLLL